MLPNLVIIGASKCGTTSLHYYLSLHPEIFMARLKELNFFVLERNWHKGIKWYDSQFKTKRKIRGETSPSYSQCTRFKGVPRRMHSIVPDTKLIYLIRDPLERTLSHYFHSYSEGVERGAITEALKDFKSNLYVDCSRYYFQLEQYLQHFPKVSILVVAQEDLLHRRLPVLQKIFRFLEVDDSFETPAFSILLNQSRLKREKNRLGRLLTQLNKTSFVHSLPPPFQEKVGRFFYRPFSGELPRLRLEESLRAELMDYFKEDMNRLKELTGQDVGDWN